MAQPELTERLEQVIDRETFLLFVAALGRDRAAAAARTGSPYQAEPGGWQSNTIEDFLEAAMAWAHTNDFATADQPGTSPWRLFAEFLHAGKISR